MNLPAIIFYFLSAVVLAAAALAATRRHPLHAALFLIVCLVGVAALFFLLGAPLLAAFQVILYAGAIVVLFLFVIMLFHSTPGRPGPLLARRSPAVALCLIMAAAILFILSVHPEGGVSLPAARSTPRSFGLALFRNYWYAVELVSFLLFVGLVGALHLGRDGHKREEVKR